MNLFLSSCHVSAGTESAAGVVWWESVNSSSRQEPVNWGLCITRVLTRGIEMERKWLVDLCLSGEVVFTLFWSCLPPPLLTQHVCAMNNWFQLKLSQLASSGSLVVCVQSSYLSSYYSNQITCTLLKHYFISRSKTFDPRWPMITMTSPVPMLEPLPPSPCNVPLFAKEDSSWSRWVKENQSSKWTLNGYIFPVFFCHVKPLLSPVWHHENFY